MTRPIVGEAGRGDGPGEIEIRIAAPVRRRYRVLAGDVPRLLAGHAAVLYSEEGEPIGDLGCSASGRMLLGASRAGLGFVGDGAAFRVDAPAFLVVRDHLRAHYYRDDGPVEVLGGGP